MTVDEFIKALTDDYSKNLPYLFSESDKRDLVEILKKYKEYEKAGKNG